VLKRSLDWQSKMFKFMSETTFWVFRFTVLTASSAVALGSILVILRDKLHQNLLMRYALALAICQLTMGLLALLFGAGSVLFNLEAIVDPITHELNGDYPTLEFLFRLEAIVFKSSEMVSFFLTAMLTHAIFKALKHQSRVPYERVILTVGVVVSILLVIVLALTDGFGMCDVH
jgi:hypothetical protein